MSLFHDGMIHWSIKKKLLKWSRWMEILMAPVETGTNFIDMSTIQWNCLRKKDSF